jgi:hypothetical protein
MLGEGPGDDGGYPHVCEQHVFLHKEVGVCLHVGAGRHGVATSIECKVEACVVQAQSARLEARVAQAGCNAVKGQAVILDLHKDTWGGLHVAVQQQSAHLFLCQPFEEET